MGYIGDNLSWGNGAADEDLSSSQYYAGKVSSDGEVALADTAGEVFAGIIDNAPSAGQSAKLVTHGVMKAKLGGTVAAFAKLAVDSAGKLVTATAGQYVGARALASGVDGDIVEVLITHEGQMPRRYLSFSIPLANLANGDIMTGFVPGFAGKIVKLWALVTTPATTAAKAATLNLEIGTTNLTGGSLALTSANMTPLGAIVEASAITAANEFDADDAISLEAASVTAFVEGAIELFIELA